MRQKAGVSKRRPEAQALKKLYGITPETATPLLQEEIKIGETITPIQTPAITQAFQTPTIETISGLTDRQMTPVQSSFVKGVGAYKGHLLIEYHHDPNIWGYALGGEKAGNWFNEILMSGSKGGWVWDKLLGKPSIYGMAKGKFFAVPQDDGTTNFFTTKGAQFVHLEGRPAKFTYNPVGYQGGEQFYDQQSKVWQEYKEKIVSPPKSRELAEIKLIEQEQQRGVKLQEELRQLFKQKFGLDFAKDLLTNEFSIGKFDFKLVEDLDALAECMDQGNTKEECFKFFAIAKSKGTPQEKSERYKKKFIEEHPDVKQIQIHLKKAKRNIKEHPNVPQFKENKEFYTRILKQEKESLKELTEKFYVPQELKAQGNITSKEYPQIHPQLNVSRDVNIDKNDYNIVQINRVLHNLPKKFQEITPVFLQNEITDHLDFQVYKGDIPPSYKEVGWDTKYEDVSGIFSIKTGNAAVSAKNSWNTARTTRHETGHGVWEFDLKEVDHDKFKELYEKYKPELKKENRMYEHNDIHEFFAISFEKTMSKRLVLIGFIEVEKYFLGLKKRYDFVEDIKEKTIKALEIAFKEGDNYIYDLRKLNEVPKDIQEKLIKKGIAMIVEVENVSKAAKTGKADLIDVGRWITIKGNHIFIPNKPLIKEMEGGNLTKSDLTEEQGRWVTMRGTHVFIKKGQSPKAALQEVISKETKRSNEKHKTIESIRKASNQKIKEKKEAYKRAKKGNDPEFTSILKRDKKVLESKQQIAILKVRIASTSNEKKKEELRSILKTAKKRKDRIQYGESTPKQKLKKFDHKHDFIDTSKWKLDFTEDYTIMYGPITHGRKGGHFDYRDPEDPKKVIRLYKDYKSLKEVHKNLDYYPIIGTQGKGSHKARVVGFTYGYEPRDDTEEIYAHGILFNDLIDISDIPLEAKRQVSIGFKDKIVGDVQYVKSVDHLAISLDNDEVGRCEMGGKSCFMEVKTDFVEDCPYGIKPVMQIREILTITNKQVV